MDMLKELLNSPNLVEWDYNVTLIWKEQFTYEHRKQPNSKQNKLLVEYLTEKS